MTGSRKPNPARIAAASQAKIDPAELPDGEDTVRVNEFTRLMGEPGEKEEAFFARRRQLGLGVGLDANGELVWASDEGEDED
ncbi:hypothetical protein LR948_11125 [Roseivivax sp. GX 12232]|uniref:hypothetical protein n=1 Tax=Roseivivax sp. GX 12232 TaxID=2900547 RepID=UPI001E399D12|nr:hypothetical protein [Roseivivax sp. GX 12232]MCE0505911.1 hypothetical protein [Roseivivax sp. GX 12232]